LQDSENKLPNPEDTSYIFRLRTYYQGVSFVNKLLNNFRQKNKKTILTGVKASAGKPACPEKEPFIE
jgi:hypothetical protein